MPLSVSKGDSSRTFHLESTDQGPYEDVKMVSINQSCFMDDTSSKSKSIMSIEVLVTFLTTATKLPGKGPLATVVMLIVSSLRQRRSAHILLSPRTLNEFGLSRGTVYRSLSGLEELGVLTVHRRKGQSPLVSLNPSLQ